VLLVKNQNSVIFIAFEINLVDRASASRRLLGNFQYRTAAKTAICVEKVDVNKCLKRMHVFKE
jgi:hypothetical protein